MTTGAVQQVRAGGIEIAYEPFGVSATPPVLLVMGPATQTIGRPDDFCRPLADRGYVVGMGHDLPREVWPAAHRGDRGAAPPRGRLP
jgi:hypothetical protein